MKKIIGIACLLFSLSGFGQQIKISGQLRTGSRDTTLQLTNTYKAIKIAITTDKHGYFKISGLSLRNGFYSLTHIGTIYLEPGYNLHIIPGSGQDTVYHFAGKGSEENNKLSDIARIDNRIIPINKQIGTLSWKYLNDPVDTFLTTVNRYNAAVAKRVAGVPNSYFKKLVTGNADSYAKTLMPTFKLSYGWDSVNYAKYQNLKDHPDKNDPFYSNRIRRAGYLLWEKILRSGDAARIDSAYFAGFDWNNRDLFNNSSYYRSLLTDAVQLLSQNMKTGKNPYLAALTIADDEISDKVIKGYVKTNFGVAYLKSSKNSAQIDSVYQNVTALPLSPVDSKRITDMYTNLHRLKENSSSLDFNYADIDGKPVTLKSLRGRYVYLDIWATWCVPCIAEIPALKKIESKYHDKNITFVGISVDQAKDVTKWKKMSADLGLDGIQVMADKDFNSDFIQSFQINSIPRFILIDPKGTVISADAFRPSNPKLDEQLKSLLK